MVKVPPHSIEAETALLAGLLGNPSTIPHVKDTLNPSDFYREAHTHICNAIFATGTNDLIAIQEYLKRHNLLEQSGGIDYLASLVDAASTSAAWENYAQLIKDYSNRRRLIELTTEAGEMAYTDHNELDETISKLKAGIRDLEADHGNGYRKMDATVKAVFKDLEHKVQSGNHHIGVLSGYENIDSHLGGFEPKSLIYLAGRPGEGKTALEWSIGRYMARNYPGWVIIFSLEMADLQLARRGLADESGVPLSRIRTGHIDESQWPGLVEAANTLSQIRLIILDQSKYKSLEKLTAKATALSHEYPITAVFIDHIQLMRARGKWNTRHQEISYISNELKSLAKDLNIPVIALCQLSRKVEERQDKRPRLSDLKESGDLEQDADLVISLFRDPYNEEILGIELLKGRDVGTFTTGLRYDRFTQRIRNDSELRY